MAKQKLTKTPITPEAFALEKLLSTVNRMVILGTVFAFLVATTAIGLWLKSAWSMDDGTDSVPWFWSGAITLIWGVCVLAVVAGLATWVDDGRKNSIREVLKRAEDMKIDSDKAREKIRQSEEAAEIAKRDAEMALENSKTSMKALAAGPDEKDRILSNVMIERDELRKQVDRSRGMTRFR